MKRILFIFMMLATVAGASAQEAYNEAIRMAKAVADDTSRSLDERRIATFKKDALYYLGSQSYKLTPDSSATMLDYQALALFQFINLFQGSLAMASKKNRAAKKDDTPKIENVAASTTLGDIDALAELKAKMEKGEK